MLYIKKEKPSEKIKRSIAAIKSTPEWRALTNNDVPGIRVKFDALPKHLIRESLLQEQHYLCAYCMKKIRNEELHMTIEHRVPLSKDKEKALDYGNFLAVCKGGADVERSSAGRVLCCDASKGDKEITIDPCDQRMMEQIAYYSNGIIHVCDNKTLSKDLVKEMETDINETLCLNGKRDDHGNLIADTATELVKGRKDSYEQYLRIVKNLQGKADLTAIKNRKEMNGFDGVVLFFLNRKRKTLLHNKTS